jgi:hypothetical protein
MKISGNNLRHYAVNFSRCGRIILLGCPVEVYRRFGGNSCLIFQILRVCEASNQQEAGANRFFLDTCFWDLLYSGRQHNN